MLSEDLSLDIHDMEDDEPGPVGLHGWIMKPRCARLGLHVSLSFGLWLCPPLLVHLIRVRFALVLWRPAGRSGWRRERETERERERDARSVLRVWLL